MSEVQSREFHWSVRAPIDEVTAVLAEPADFARWWPSAWRECVEVAPGAVSGVGRVVSVASKGRSPVLLAWSIRCVESASDAWTYELFGDLEGKLNVMARVEAGAVRVTFTWAVALKRASMRAMPFAELTIASDLAWMMAQGEASMRRELALRASNVSLGEAPGPTTSSTLPWTLAGVGLAAAVAGVIGLLLRRRA